MQGTATAPTGFGPLGTGEHFAELTRRLDEYWRGTAFASVSQDGKKRWRRFPDCTAAEKRNARKLYEAGQNLMRIASAIRAYPGSIVSAAETGGWKRPPEMVRSLSSQIIELANGPDGPMLSNQEIADRLLCDRGYVSAVRLSRNAPCAQKRSKRQYQPPPPATMTPAMWAFLIVADAERIARSLVHWKPHLCPYLTDLETAAILAPVDRSMCEAERLRTMGRAARQYADENLLGRTTSLDAARGPHGYSLLELGAGAVSAR